ncbi:hypothetical protein K438DRAFT_1771167 [Mycena galopus ATCC 62051]|nr:hypothetical protein K438DRAFT_1771167 [Mycena galopus ATCC 62051]
MTCKRVGRFIVKQNGDSDLSEICKVTETISDQDGWRYSLGNILGNLTYKIRVHDGESLSNVYGQFLSRIIWNKDDWSTSNPGLDPSFPGKEQVWRHQTYSESIMIHAIVPSLNLMENHGKNRFSKECNKGAKRPVRATNDMLGKSGDSRSGQSTCDRTQSRSKQYTDALRDQESKRMLNGNLQFQVQKKWVKDSRSERSQ